MRPRPTPATLGTPADVRTNALPDATAFLPDARELGVYPVEMPFRILTIVATALGVSVMPVLASPAHADSVAMAAHEASYVSPNGVTFMVGNRNEVINRIPPLNMLATSREAFVSSVSYGRLDGGDSGKIMVGYHVGCAVTLGSGTVGVEPDVYVDSNSDNSVDDFNVGPVAVVELSPGEIVDVPVAEKKMVPGDTISLGVRDFHITVNSCVGPVNIRQYTYVLFESTKADDSGAVFGDPLWL
ncbi:MULTISPECIES: MspA family porin [unclassified Nocardia]|uniref:MspA family porin n=1 Tax=unclassified Nocardia TaxID=2637762 RepID=UPI0033A53752